MSQQGHWRASALAATCSSTPGFGGATWGAALQPLHINTGMGFGLRHEQNAEQNVRARQKRKNSADDELMDSSSPTPEPQGTGRRIRNFSEARRHNAIHEDEAQTAGASFQVGRRHTAAHRSSAHGLEGRKRCRVDVVGRPNEVSLDKLLEPLEENSLRSLLDTLISHNPQLADQIRELVPKPTVNSACSQLMRLERRLQAAFPYNKSGPATDDYTYHRVRPALEELHDTIVMYLEHFTHHGLTSNQAGPNHEQANALEHPAEWFELLAQATDVAMRMPKWDRTENNEIRRGTLQQLANGWLRAIIATLRWSEEGHLVGRDMVSQWGSHLNSCYVNSGEPSLFQPALQVFHQGFGHYNIKLSDTSATVETTV